MSTPLLAANLSSFNRKLFDDVTVNHARGELTVRFAGKKQELAPKIVLNMCSARRPRRELRSVLLSGGEKLGC
jgi:hypothetical protein